MLIISLLLVYPGCVRKSTPETAVEQLIEASRTFDFQAMGQAVSPEVRNRADLEEFWQEGEEDLIQNAAVDYLLHNNAKMTYTIRDMEINGDRAQVKVDFVYVDGLPVVVEATVLFINQALQAALSGQALTDTETAELFAKVLSQIRTERIEVFRNETITFPCVLIGGGWYVDDLSPQFLNVILSNISQLGETTAF